MGTNIENEVLRLSMENRSFMQGTEEAIKALDTLESKAQFKKPNVSLGELGKIISGFNLSELSRGIDSINNRFSLLGIAGISAINNIVSAAMNAGTRIVKSLTIDPITTGFKEYETQIGAIQTILANTSKDGVTLTNVIAALDELNEYSDRTIYNFTEMTKNIGTFTAAGVKLDVSVAAIKGIANLAAVSGSNSQQAATAMYQLSQALASGTVKLMDWNSVVNAGMGGKIFQDALMETARLHKISIDQMIKDEGSFRETLQRGWLTSEILTETLSKFTGDLNEEQLTAMGYTKDQITEIVKLGKMANDAATKVKTITQLYDVLKESVQSGWGVTSRIIFGDFEQAKSLFTSISAYMTDIIGKSSDSRNQLLTEWANLGGRDDLVYALFNTMSAVKNIFDLFKGAIEEIFPPVTAKQLKDFTSALKTLTENFKMAEGFSDRLRRVIKGLAAFLDIIGMGLISYTKDILNFSKGALPTLEQIFDFLANQGDALVNLRNWVKETDFWGRSSAFLSEKFKILITFVTDLIEKSKLLYAQMVNFSIFKSISKFISGVVEKFKLLISTIQTLAPEFINFLKTLSFGKVESIQSFGEKIAKAFEPIGGIVSFIAKVVMKVMPIIFELGRIASEVFGKLTTSLLETLSTVDVNKLLTSLNLGLFGGFLLSLQTFVGKGSGILGVVSKLFTGFVEGVSSFGGIGKGIVETLDALKTTLEAYQQSLKADVLLKIAIAIGVIAASIVALSLIDPVRLKTSITAISILLAELLGSTSIFARITGTTDPRALISMTGALNAIAGSILLFAASVYILSKLDSEELSRGLIGITTALIVMGSASAALSRVSGNLVPVAFGLMVLSGALLGITASVYLLSRIDGDRLTKGVVAVGALLTELGLFASLTRINVSSAASYGGLILLSGAMLVFAFAVERLSKLKQEELVNSIAAIGVILTEVGLFISLTKSANIMQTSLGLTVVAATILIFAEALNRLSAISWENLAKGLTGLGGLLLLVGVAMSAFPPNMLLNATALLVVSGALVAFSSALVSIAKLSGDELGRGLLAMSAGLAVLVGVLYSMTGTLAGSAAMLVASAALVVFASALQALSLVSWENLLKGLAGMAGILVILGIAGAVMTPLIPTILAISGAMFLFGLGVAAVGAGIFLVSIGLTTLAAGIVAFSGSIAIGLAALLGVIPTIINVLRLTLVGVLEVFNDALPLLIDTVMLVLGGLLDSIVYLGPKLAEVVSQVIGPFLAAIVEKTPAFIEAGFDMVEAFLQGIKNNVHLVPMAIDVVNGFLDGLGSRADAMIDTGFNFAISFIDAMASGLEEHGPALYESLKDLGYQIVVFLGEGTLEGLTLLTDGITILANAMIDAFKDALGIASPSEIFKGLTAFVIDGILLGLGSGVLLVVDKIVQFSEDMIEAFSNMSSGFVTVGSGAILAIGVGFLAGKNGLVTTISIIVSSVLDRIDAYSTNFYNRGMDLVRSIQLGAQSQNGSIVGTFTIVLQSVLTRLDQYKSVFQQRGLSIIIGFALGFLGGSKQLLKTFARILDLLSETVISYAQKIHELGLFLVNTISIGFLSGLENLLKTLDVISDQAILRLNANKFEFLKVGSTLVGAIQDGFIKRRETFLKVIYDTIGVIIKAFYGLVQVSYTSGRLVAESFAKGIRDNLGVVKSAVKNMTDITTNTISNELQMHSPSKKLIDFGLLAGGSFASGLDKSFALVKSASNNLVDALKDAMSLIDEEVGDMSPVIRPIVDLSDLKKMRTQVGSIFSPSVSSRLPDLAYAGGSSNITNVKEERFEFNQTIQSNRPINPEEIYRQTKNLLATKVNLRGGIDD